MAAVVHASLGHEVQKRGLRVQEYVVKKMMIHRGHICRHTPLVVVVRPYAYADVMNVCVHICSHRGQSGNKKAGKKKKEAGRRGVKAGWATFLAGGARPDSGSALGNAAPPLS